MTTQGKGPERDASDPMRGGLEALAARIVADTVKQEVLASKRVARGLMTLKCFVDTSRDGYVVRFYPHDRQSVVDCEPDLWRRCRASQIPVPEVLADSRSGPPSRLPYVVYRRIEGYPLLERLPALTRRQQAATGDELVDHLSRMGALSLKGSGELTSATHAAETSWSEFIQASVNRGIEAIVQHALLDTVEIRALERIAGDLLPASMVENHLIWGDIGFDNIIVRPDGGIASLLDFESCLSGDPRATWGYLFARHGDHSFCVDLVARHSRDDTAQAIRRYAVVRALRLAPFAHLPLPTGCPRDRLTDIFPGLSVALHALAQEPNTGGSP